MLRLSGPNCFRIGLSQITASVFDTTSLFQFSIARGNIARQPLGLLAIELVAPLLYDCGGLITVCLKQNFNRDSSLRSPSVSVTVAVRREIFKYQIASLVYIFFAYQSPSLVGNLGVEILHLSNNTIVLHNTHTNSISRVLPQLCVGVGEGVVDGLYFPHSQSRLLYCPRSRTRSL